MLTALDTHSSTKKNSGLASGSCSSPFKPLSHMFSRLAAGTCVHTQQGPPPPLWDGTGPRTGPVTLEPNVATKISRETLASLKVYLKKPQKNPARAAKSASLISERGENICYSALETIRRPSLALALAASHCAAAICPSAVGPCYLLFPFWSCSLSARGPLSPSASVPWGG